ncbi:MAG: TonB-dependent receptor [Gemmatimonas sp.]
MAQSNGRIIGMVRDSAQKTPVAFATLVIDGKPTSRTGEDGRYAINDVAPGQHVLRTQLLGYVPKTDTVRVGPSETVTHDFTVRATGTTLQQMVVVGYGEQRRSDLTGAVSSITPNVDRAPVTSIEQTLQGTVAGVQVTQASSAPGGGMSIRIRGGSSVNGSNEPLYVVDGFPIENNPATDGDPTNGGRTNTAPANPLAALNPSDIASIEILKDASATSIYGSRGANGVVMITTKRGEAGKPKFTIDAYTGTQEVAQRYDLLNGAEYAQYANDYVLAGSPTATVPFADPSSFGAGTDWQSAIFRRASMYSVQLGVTGGSAGANGTRYSLTGGVFQQDGVVQNSDFKRLSLRGNLEQTVGNLRLSGNLFLSRVTSSQVPTDGSFNAGAGAVGAAIQYAPIMPIRLADGTYSLNRNDYPQVLRAAGLAPGDIPNPVSMALDVQDNLSDTRVLANSFGEYTFPGNFKARVSVGTDISNRSRDTYYPRTTLMGLNSNGRAQRGQIWTTGFLNENTLTWSNLIGGIHDITIVGGYTRQTQIQTRQGLINTNFVSDITGVDDIGAGTQVGGPSVTSNKTRYTLASYLGRLNYTLKDRYLLTATARRDGSSRFGADNQWGVFPSIGLGWRVSEESFVRNITWINQLKLRGSAGTTGNPSISPYQSISRLSTGKYAFNGTVLNGYYPALIGNSKLSWESTKQTDYGIDATLFNNRIDLSADVYDKTTKDLLLAIDLPSETGYASALTNAGSISNKGVEVALTLRPFKGESSAGAFALSSTITYTRNRNKVLDLGGVDRIFATSSVAPDLGSSGTLVQVGQPLGAFYGYKTAGIIRDTVEANAYTTTVSGARITQGALRYVDINGDNIIDANDRTIIGDPNPDYLLGLNNTVSFKGFELSGLLDGVFGPDILNLNLYRVEGGSPITNVTRDRYYDRWTATNHDGKFPRINSAPGALGAEFTDFLLQDGSYFRLRTITLTRAIPSSWIKGRGFNSARFYVTGANIWTSTKYRGFNPDVSSQGVGNLNRGIDVGAYPLARTWTFGMNLTY